MQQKFSERFSQLLDESGLSYEKFGLRIGIDKSYVSRLASGRAINPSMELLNNICSKLGVSYQWLVNGIGEKTVAQETVNEDPEPYRTKTVAESWAETSDEQFEKILLRCIEIKDWGGAEKMAAELHRRALAALNRELKEKLK